jgi:FixJ family two-component response regulator
MPGLSGSDVQRTLIERSARLPIVFISGHGDIPAAVQAMKAGAVDFLPKPFDREPLLEAVRRALAQHECARQEEADRAKVRQRAESLSAREREVMALVVTGLLNKQVGHRLGVTEQTVKAHRARVMRKMQADSLAQLVRLAEKLGIASPPP